MTNNIELLAPGGDLDAIKAAISAGADAVYCGLDRFNARNRAENISFQTLLGVLRLAHANNCRIFLTLNIVIVEPEIPAFVRLLNKLVNTGIDGIIIQDIGMMYLIANHFPTLKIHASTQVTTHNSSQIDFLEKLGVERANLCRELSLEEIAPLVAKAQNCGIDTEVFVHGSHCISFSGLCYMSSVLDGKSGNRGRCSQPCRDQYEKSPAGKEYPLNLKDNCAIESFDELAKTGVKSIKIEGRIKKSHYVYSVVKTWKDHLKSLMRESSSTSETTVLHKVFNRGFSNGYLQGRIGKQMFTDNPRDNSAHHLSETFDGSSKDNLDKAKRQLYDEKTEIITSVNSKIRDMNTDPPPVSIRIAGAKGENLLLEITGKNIFYSIKSECFTTKVEFERTNDKGKEPENLLNEAALQKLVKGVSDSGYRITEIDTKGLEENLALPFSELTRLKRELFAAVNEGRKYQPPITLTQLKKAKRRDQEQNLSVLVSTLEDIQLCGQITGDLFFEIPSCCGDRIDEFIDIFATYPRLKPWFPAIISDSDSKAHVTLLEKLQPQSLISNNSGIGFEAYKRGINWIAGPYLNIVNSYSLLCLQEKFHCSGAFISNELNNYQIKFIKNPENFDLYYSVYHPLMLMTSRQCLFQQVTGCEKSEMDSACLRQCQKAAILNTLKDGPLYIEKSKGNYHTIYNDENFLNTDIISDIQNMFSSYFLDLRDIKTGTEKDIAKSEFVKLFEQYIAGDIEKSSEIKKKITKTTNAQYIKGI